MSSCSLKTFDHYRYGPRSLLVPGDKFRVSGGPVYISDDGTKIAMGERGVFVFRCYCVRGTAKWIEALRADGGGVVVLWVGKPTRSHVAPNLRRKAYRVARVGKPTPPRRVR